MIMEEVYLHVDLPSSVWDYRYQLICFGIITCIFCVFGSVKRFYQIVIVFNRKITRHLIVSRICQVLGAVRSFIMARSILKTILSRLCNTEVGEDDEDTEVAEMPELYLSLTKNCLEEVDRMAKISTLPKFNHEQCSYLVDKLRMAVQGAHLFVSAEDTACSLEIFKLLFLFSKEVENFIWGCCKDPWIQSAIMLTGLSEHVLSLGLNLENCITGFSNKKKFLALPTVAKVASVREAEAEIVEEKANVDRVRLLKDVNFLIQSSKSSKADSQLATFLHERLENPRQHLSPDFPKSSQSTYSDILDRGLKQMEKLGSGAYGIVHKAMWLGVEVAKKSFHGPGSPDFLQEVNNLLGLYDPNIVSLVWHMKDERKGYIIMELMDGDLYSLIQERLQGCENGDPPFSILEAMHIILQVAEGMLFLHDKRIVHGDLKPQNILVRHVATEVNVQYVHVKVADFGLSKTKERSQTHSIQTQNIGTTRYMAPELIKHGNLAGKIEKEEIAGKTVEEEITVITVGEEKHFPFKCDVHSFAMLCYEILTGVPHFTSFFPNEMKLKLLSGDRPDLPNHCPDRLSTLMKDCWSWPPNNRPSFQDICAQLRHFKCAHIISFKHLFLFFLCQY